ncbi:hypothetical protein [Microbacterium sp.]|uniref:hypothetical protein n=1 Tax=Microbacterium sp. TaxID=51671 RepID=UPI003F948995
MRDFTEVFLWIGFAGAGIALLCALVALAALARGSAGLVGGAVAVWIGGALLSLTSGFSGQWIPALIAMGALAVALVVGGMLRPVVRAYAARPKAELPEPVASPSGGTSSAPRRVVGVRTVASESIR